MLHKVIKKILKWLLITVVLLIAAALALYWSAPYWVPHYLAGFLPPSIQLEELEFERPGLTTTNIKQLTFQVNEHNSLLITLNEVDLHYSLWHKKLTSIDAKIAKVRFISTEKSSSTELSNKIALPVIPLEQVNINQLSVEGLLVQNLLLSNVRARFLETESALDATIHFEQHQLTSKLKLTSAQQVLQQAELYISQGQDNLSLQLSPKPSTEHAWNWSAAGDIEANHYYPIEIIDTIRFKLAGDFDRDTSTEQQKSLISINPNSYLKTAIDGQRLRLEESITSTLQKEGVRADFTQLSQKIPLTLSIQEPAIFTYENTVEPMIILLQGNMGVELSNPHITFNSNIEQLTLALQQPLSAPQQLLKSELKIQLNSKNVEYKKETLIGHVETISNNIVAHISLQNGSLSFVTDQWDIKLASASLQDHTYKALFPASEWRAKADWFISSLEPLTIDKKKLEFSNKQPISNQIQLSDDSIELTKLNSNILLDNKMIHARYSLDKVHLKNSPLVIGNIKGSAKVNLDTLFTQGKTDFNQLAYNDESLSINYISGQLNWNKKGEVFTAEGRLLQSENSIPFQYQLSLKDSQHSLSIPKASLPVLTLKSWIKLFKNYPALQVNSGDLMMESIVGNPFELLFSGKINIPNLSLSYDELQLVNWSIEDTLSPTSPLLGQGKHSIETIQIASGIDISKIQFELNHQAKQIDVKNIKGQLLGGELSLEQVTILTDAIRPFVLQLSNIDMARLLAAFNSQKINIDGHFNFKLPITIGMGKQEITHGHFQNLGTGVIQVKNDLGEGANIAYQALENFHYKELSGDIDYDQEGNYTIVLHLLGSNPNLYNGFPIKLDLTLRGHLPDLLYSMLVTGDIAKPVLNELKL